MSDLFNLVGHESSKAQFDTAFQSGKLHHAWIISGPSGIGKSLFVKQLCAKILGSEGAFAEDAAKTVLAGSHPDLKWVQRELNERGQLRQDIRVEQIRELNHFFSLKPGLVGWRVGAIDSLDEMNVSGLNALLKTLEEPPQNAILFLISHGTKPLLPTIRSRCQVLRLAPLADEETRLVLSRQEQDTSAVEDLASGRPGFALQIAEAGLSPVVLAVKGLLADPKKPSPQKVAEALSAASATQISQDVFCRLLMDWCAKRAMSEPSYSTLWFDLHRTKTTADDLNLTPLQTVSKLWSIVHQYERVKMAA